MNGRLPHQINRLGLARTFQNIRLFRALTALDNVKVACRAQRPLFTASERCGGWPREARRERLDASTTTSTGGGRSCSRPGFQAEERELTAQRRASCWR